MSTVCLFFSGKTRGRNVILPKIDNGRAHGKKFKGNKGKRRPATSEAAVSASSQAPYDPNTALTLELKHGEQKHKVDLPTEKLDKSKKYYVTFTINRGKNGEVIENGSLERPQLEEDDEYRYEQQLR